MPMLKSALSLFATTVLVNGSTFPIGKRQGVHELTAWNKTLCDDFAEQTFSSVPSGVDVECAWFTVPLDYANSTVGTTRLATIRSPATGNRKGSLFFNPGGPGGGIDAVTTQIPRLRADVGDAWDIISFAPRAVFPSGPEDIWSPTLVEEYIQAFSNPVFTRIGNLTTQPDADFLMSQVSSYDQILTGLHESILKHSGDKLKYVGTLAVVRDIAALVDELDGENADINFWGVSYGTMIGMELTQLFPDRIGKVIIDGVVDPEYWTQKPAYQGHSIWFSDTDASYRGFTQVCAAAGPERCALALEATDTAEVIDARIQAALTEHYQRDPTSYAGLAFQLYSLPFLPDEWDTLVPIAAQSLGIATPISKSVPLSPLPLGRQKLPWPILPALPVADFRKRQALDGATILGYYASLTAVAITCGDSVDDNSTTEEVFKDRIRTSREVSPRFGSFFNWLQQCHLWQVRAVERHTGGWNATLKNTVLVVGTEGDPICPFNSAKQVASEKFLGASARLVQVWDFGHCSISTNSTSLRNTLLSYLNDDVLPADKGSDDIDLTCPTNMSLLGTNSTIHWDPVTSERDPEEGEDGDDKNGENNNNGNGDQGSGASLSYTVATFMTVISTTALGFWLVF